MRSLNLRIAFALSCLVTLVIAQIDREVRHNETFILCHLLLTLPSFLELAV